MDRFTITWTDARFDDTSMTADEKVDMIRMMMAEGTLNFEDAFVSTISVKVTSKGEGALGDASALLAAV